MAERNFTKHFKNNLADKLNDYFKKKNINLICKTEHQIRIGSTPDKIDIAVFRKNEPEEHNPSRLIGIEIEIISSFEQIKINYDKFTKWVHASDNRKGGLLHIIAYDANIDERGISDLLLSTYANMSGNRRMYYEFYALNDMDQRKTAITAKDFVLHDWEFDVRLFALIVKVFGRWYLPK